MKGTYKKGLGWALLVFLLLVIPLTYVGTRNGTQIKLPSNESSTFENLNGKTFWLQVGDVADQSEASEDTQVASKILATLVESGAYLADSQQKASISVKIFPKNKEYNLVVKSQKFTWINTTYGTADDLNSGFSSIMSTIQKDEQNRQAAKPTPTIQTSSVE